MRIIKTIKDIDYLVMKSAGVKGDKFITQYEIKHGTVIYATGYFSDDEDALISLGTVDGKSFETVFYVPFLDFSVNYYISIGREDLAQELLRIKNSYSRE